MHVVSGRIDALAESGTARLNVPLYHQLKRSYTCMHACMIQSQRTNPPTQTMYTSLSSTAGDTELPN